MKHVLLAFVVVLEFARAGAAQAQDSAKAEIEAVISAQIEAFRGDDFVTAFGFAADNIQRMFLTPENFGAMVQRGYPMVYRPQTVQFGSQSLEGAAVWQRVLMKDAQGVTHALDYLMVPQGGVWRIAAVQLQPALDAAA